MKYLELLPPTAKTLKQSLLAKYHNDGKSEEIDLAYSKIPSIEIDHFNFIFSHPLLKGEALLLQNVSDFIIVGDKFFQYEGKKINLKLQGKTLQIGSPLIDALVTVSNEITKFQVDEVIDSLLPLPFRDNSFDNVVISELLDYDVVKESFRVLKNSGNVYLILYYADVSPIEGVKVLSTRFIIKDVKEMQKYWIIRGNKKIKA